MSATAESRQSNCSARLYGIGAAAEDRGAAGVAKNVLGAADPRADVGAAGGDGLGAATVNCGRAGRSARFDDEGHAVVDGRSTDRTKDFERGTAVESDSARVAAGIDDQSAAAVDGRAACHTAALDDLRTGENGDPAGQSPVAPRR